MTPAALFLACLLGRADAELSPITFQTFDDAKPGGKARPDLALARHGILRDLLPMLEAKNRAGAGVFVTVNEMDGRGRKKTNARFIRGWWADLDTEKAPANGPAFTPEALPIEPTMIVQTPGGWHLYWLAFDLLPCGTSEAQAEFEAELKAIQKHLAPFGADPAVCDVSRVLRLPGFTHCKAEPRPVMLVKVNGPRYSREDIRAAFNALHSTQTLSPSEGETVGSTNTPTSKPKQATPGRSSGVVRPAPSVRDGIYKRAAAYLATLPPGIQGQDGSGATFSAALKLITGFDLASDEALDLMLSHFNPRCIPAWSENELRHKVQDAWASAQHSTNRGHLVEDSHCRKHFRNPPPSTFPISNREVGTDEGNSDAPTSPSTKPPTNATPSANHRPAVPGFKWKDHGLYHIKAGGEDHNGNDKASEETWIAPPFELPALVRDESSSGWSLLIRWADLDSIQHEEPIPVRNLEGEGTEVFRKLADGGLILPPDIPLRKLTLRYLSAAARKVPGRARLVDSLGWMDGAFVLPCGECVGDSAEPLRYSGERPSGSMLGQKGTLDGWRDGVASLAVGNPRLAFALSCAFAGPLLDLIRPDGGGGFNLMGESSRGKSTCLEAAASVWGRPHPLPTWRATANGLEGLAAARNDGFLVLDELSQVDPKEAAAVAYMLANGSAKARAGKAGEARAMKQWRLIFLGSGEQSLEEKLSEDGKRVRAGQEVRVPDIPAPIGGMFQHAHELPDFAALSQHLKNHARKHYGHAARVFLRNITQEWHRRESLVTRCKQIENTWLASVLPPHVDGQVKRVAHRFATVAIAGELATEMEILPWPSGTAQKAAAECFHAWLDRRGFSGASEVYRGIQAVLAFLEKHGQSRFDEWGKEDSRIINRAGTRKRCETVGHADAWDYFITPEAWKEACQGFSAATVARACVDAGILEADAQGKTAQSIRIPGHGRARVYAIRAQRIAQYMETEAR